ncbi:MAG TPA: DNA-3-methyladenine glycosylase [Cyclobacteriaceae bacterium]
MNHFNILDKSFYLRQDCVAVARALIGKNLFSNIEGVLTAGKIVETEAYCGENDKASHAYGGRRTTRTEIMYQEGGVAYVYLIYGIYHLFNVVTNAQDTPHAVLVRALEPNTGIETMMRRRRLNEIKKNLTGGPGLLTQALGIKRSHSGTSLLGDQLWIEDVDEVVTDDQIESDRRVGVDYAEEYSAYPWRFFLKANKWVSKKKLP